MICNRDCQPKHGPLIKVLQQSVYYSLDFPDFLGVVAELRDRIEFVKEE
ncbi:MAG: hypothetical protein WA215_11885 [Candidatus Cybelea sp.]